MAVGAFYSACDIVLSPSPASDARSREIGMPAERIMRWDRGVDTSRFDPSLRDARAAGPAAATGARSTCSTPGGITREKGAELLADAFLRARAREPRLHLVLAGGGPEQERLRERARREHATFLGWLSGAELARAYASADLFLFPCATDTFGQVILEAQASGLPVIAVAEGGPLSLIEDRVTGLLCEADARALADALLELAGSPLLRERLPAPRSPRCASAPGSGRCSGWARAIGGCSRRRGAVTFTTPRSRARREPFRAPGVACVGLRGCRDLAWRRV